MSRSYYESWVMPIIITVSQHLYTRGNGEHRPLRNPGIVENQERSSIQIDVRTGAFLAFSSDIQGKDIELFDDVTTRETSFAQAAAELKRKGAMSVYGLFIGKTV